MHSSSRKVYIQTLRRAAEIIGGVQPLAVFLDVRPEDIDAWLKGEAEPPPEVFLTAVDILMDDSTRQ